MFARFLDGIRIADFTWAGAGPYATKLFSDFGAEVLKIESAVRSDPVRSGPPYKDGIKGLNRSGYFASRNNGKLSVSIDLKSDRGRQLARELIAQSDIVANNFGPSVMDKLGLGYGEIAKIKPDIIYLGMPMYGESGPLSQMLGVGMTISAVAGLTDLTGYHDGPPLGAGTHFPDHAVNPYHGAFALLSALRYRRLTGRGMRIDLSQVESTVNAIGIPFAQWAMTGEPPARIGNRSAQYFPHNVFRCKGEDTWCAVAVQTDAQWQALCVVMERPDLSSDAELADVGGRQMHVDAIEQAVSDWAATLDKFDMMRRLQEVGVPAGAVESSRDLVERDLQLRDRGYWQEISHPEMGVTRFTSPPYLIDGERIRLSRPPLLGEHSEEVLSRVLGYAPEEISKLNRDGVLR